MPVVLGDTERDADRFRFTLADDVAVVETAQKLDQYLESNPDEDLVVVGPDVTMAVATEVAETYRLRRPFLGVVLMRRRMEVSTMTEALRAGVREVVLADDVEALVGACKRSMAVSEQLRNVEAGDGPTRGGKIILVFSSKGGCGKTTISTNLAAALSSGPGRWIRCACSTSISRPATSPSPCRWIRPAPISDALGMQGGLDERTLASLVVPYKAEHGRPARPDEAVGRGVRVGRPRRRDRPGRGEHVRLRRHRRSAGLHRRRAEVLRSRRRVRPAHHAGHAGPEEPRRSPSTHSTTSGSPGASGRSILNRGGSRVGLTASDIERTVGVPISVEIPSSVEVPARLNEGVTVVEANAEARRGSRLLRAGRQAAQDRRTPKPVAPVKRSLFKRG